MKHEFGLTNLGSGSSGNATVIHGPEGCFLLDAGFSAKELCRRMELCGIAPECIRAILITHDHSDHTRGCRVFSDRYHIPVYVTDATGRALANRHELGKDVVLFTPGTAFDLCGIRTEPFSIPHDSPDTVAFTFTCHTCKIAVATDLGFINELTRCKLADAKILMMESNHDLKMLAASSRPLSLKRRIMGRFGHLSNDTTINELERLLTNSTSYLMLAHLSSECNDRTHLEALAMEKLELIHRNDILLKIAEQTKPTPTIWAI